MTGRAGPTPKADPETVARLAADGHGRNSVARTLGVSRRAVDAAARAAGVTWVRTGTAAATAARLADVRADLTDQFTEAADLATGRLIEALQADDLDPGILRALATVAGISADKLISLGDRVSAAEDRGDSLLDQLRAGIDSWAAGLADQDQTEETIERKEHER
ncbi:MAG: hypothetical protein H5T76_23715 [Streptomyces sp.]|nr:hypothetical protein [Streptomyces sp.]